MSNLLQLGLADTDLQDFQPRQIVELKQLIVSKPVSELQKIEAKQLANLLVTLQLKSEEPQRLDQFLLNVFRASVNNTTLQLVENQYTDYLRDLASSLQNYEPHDLILQQFIRLFSWNIVDLKKSKNSKERLNILRQNATGQMNLPPASYMVAFIERCNPDSLVQQIPTNIDGIESVLFQLKSKQEDGKARVVNYLDMKFQNSVDNIEFETPKESALFSYLRKKYSVEDVKQRIEKDTSLITNVLYCIGFDQSANKIVVDPELFVVIYNSFSSEN